MASVHEVERGAEVVHLASPVVEAARARADTAEVEAQNGAAHAAEGFRRLEDGLRVHRAAVLRMRVANDDGRVQAAGLAALHQAIGVHAPLERRLVNQRLE